MAKLRRTWRSKVKDAHGHRLRRPPVPGLGVAGGFKMMVEDRGGLGLPPCSNRPMRLIRKLQQEPGLTGVSTQFRSNTPQLVHGHRPHQSRDAGRLARRRRSDAADRIWARCTSTASTISAGTGRSTIQADGTVPRSRSGHQMLKVRNKPGQDGPAGHAGQDRARSSGPVMVTRYNLYSAAPINGNMRPARQLRRGDRGDRRAWPTRPCRCR